MQVAVVKTISVICQVLGRGTASQEETEAIVSLPLVKYHAPSPRTRIHGQDCFAGKV